MNSSLSQVYVYATDGYTETSIKDFLVKINPRVAWIVRSPFNQKKTKKDYAARQAAGQPTGRTGRDLIQFMEEELRRHPVMLTSCYAIVLEDDIDFEDAGVAPHIFINGRIASILSAFQEIEPNYTAQIICMFAAPEIETWFVADWSNGFGSLNLERRIARDLRKKIQGELLITCGNLECYSSHFTGKFSDWIVKAIETLASKYNVTDKTLAAYSKRQNGPTLLSKINPSKVAAECRHYFADAYRQIMDIP